MSLINSKTALLISATLALSLNVPSIPVNVPSVSVPSADQIQNAGKSALDAINDAFKNPESYALDGFNAASDQIGKNSDKVEPINSEVKKQFESVAQFENYISSLASECNLNLQGAANTVSSEVKTNLYQNITVGNTYGYVLNNTQEIQVAACLGNDMYTDLQNSLSVSNHSSKGSTSSKHTTTTSKSRSKSTSTPTPKPIPSPGISSSITIETVSASLSVSSSLATPTPTSTPIKSSSTKYTGGFLSGVLAVLILFISA